jgi:hypothetical protein
LKTRVDPHAHRIIRHAYEEVVTACARLISFSTGGWPKTDGPIDARQEMLAVEDLINFAIHARRLIENTGQKMRFQKIEISFPQGQGPPPHIRISDVINVIVHHRAIDLIRSKNQKLFKLGQIDQYEFLTNPDECVPPMVIATSDKKTLVFPILELIETFQEQILSIVIDLCAEHHLFLDEDFDL